MNTSRFIILSLLGLLILGFYGMFSLHNYANPSYPSRDIRFSDRVVRITEADGTVRLDFGDEIYQTQATYEASLIEFGLTPEQAKEMAEYTWQRIRMAQQGVSATTRQALGEQFEREFKLLPNPTVFPSFSE